jgi:hypothetical protein
MVGRPTPKTVTVDNVPRPAIPPTPAALNPAAIKPPIANAILHISIVVKDLAAHQSSKSSGSSSGAHATLLASAGVAAGVIFSIVDARRK